MSVAISFCVVNLRYAVWRQGELPISWRAEGWIPPFGRKGAHQDGRSAGFAWCNPDPNGRTCPILRRCLACLSAGRGYSPYGSPFSYSVHPRTRVLCSHRKTQEASCTMRFLSSGTNLGTSISRPQNFFVCYFSPPIGSMSLPMGRPSDGSPFPICRSSDGSLFRWVALPMGRPLCEPAWPL